METVKYTLDDGVATIVIDDGKRNALAPSVLSGINAALDQAESDGAIVIITGREDVFSAGFDLKVMKRGGGEAIGMSRAGYCADRTFAPVSAPRYRRLRRSFNGDGRVPDAVRRLRDRQPR